VCWEGKKGRESTFLIKKRNLLGADGLVLVLPGGDVVVAAAADPATGAPPVEDKAGNKDERLDDDAATETEGEAEKEPEDGRVEIAPAGPRKGEEAWVEPALSLSSSIKEYAISI
jgi:hypothetical protein